MVDQDAQRAPSHPRKDENEITKGQVRTRVTLSPAVPHMMATRSPAPKFAQFKNREGLDLWETYDFTDLEYLRVNKTRGMGRANG